VEEAGEQFGLPSLRPVSHRIRPQRACLQVYGDNPREGALPYPLCDSAYQASRGPGKTCWTAPLSSCTQPPGLCGNFNQNQADDFTALSGLVEGTGAAFANTWKTQATCPNAKNSFEDPCSLSVENGTSVHSPQQHGVTGISGVGSGPPHVGRNASGDQGHSERQ
jgi:hypothetical protein